MREKLGRELPVVVRRIKEDIRQHGAGVLAVVMLYFLLHAVFDAFCLSVIVTGFPCPGCGMTRAVLYLLRGQFSRSWALNPAAVFWVIWAICFAFERYIRGRRSKMLVWALYGIGLFMVASYLVRMRMYFPDRPPYVYTRNNLLSKLIPFYEEMVRHLIARGN